MATYFAAATQLGIYILLCVFVLIYVFTLTLICYLFQTKNWHVIENNIIHMYALFMYENAIQAQAYILTDELVR